MEFFEKLKKARKENGMSQEELANQLSVSRQAVSRWESGQGYPETDKLLMMSNIFNVSLDYLLKEDGQLPEGEADAGYYASRETVEGYLAYKRKGARRIGIGVAVMILGLVFPMAMGGGRAGLFFLLAVAVGIVLLVMQGFSPKHYEKIEQLPLTFDAAFLREFQAMHAKNRKRYGILVVAGLLLIILSFVAAMLLNNFAPSADGRGNAILPVLWAMAVYLFTIAGSALSSEGVIAKNEQHMAEVVQEKNSGWVFGAGMPLAAMAFLAIGFIWGAWHPGWLVFPAAVFICLAIVGWQQARK